MAGCKMQQDATGRACVCRCVAPRVSDSSYSQDCFASSWMAHGQTQQAGRRQRRGRLAASATGRRQQRGRLAASATGRQAGSRPHAWVSVERQSGRLAVGGMTERGGKMRARWRSCCRMGGGEDCGGPAMGGSCAACCACSSKPTRSCEGRGGGCKGRCAAVRTWQAEGNMGTFICLRSSCHPVANLHCWACTHLRRLLVVKAEPELQALQGGQLAQHGGGHRGLPVLAPLCKVHLLRREGVTGSKAGRCRVACAWTCTLRAGTSRSGQDPRKVGAHLTALLYGCWA